MAEKIVSFIIPAYNSEKYIDKCLNSFCVPIVLDDIEVLVVNDGSTDKTYAIGNNYAKKHPKTFRVINKENGGHGSAINLGAKFASGKFFKVIDADDWIVSENLPNYVNKLKCCNSEVILTNYYTIDISTGKQISYDLSIKELEKETTLNYLVKNWKSVKNGFTFHGITYLTRFYNRWEHILPEKIYYEDHEYSTIPCCFADKVTLLNVYLYVYQVGNADQSIAYQNQLNRRSHLEKVLNRMLSYYYKQSSPWAEASKGFYLNKLEIIALSYYKLVCIISPNKKTGRELARRQHTFIKRCVPALWKRIQYKYCIFIILNYVGLSLNAYTEILNSPSYKLFKRNKQDKGL